MKTDSPWEFFTLNELTCQCGTCGQMLMNDDFMELMVFLRNYLDFPLPISSAYRCPAHNQRVSSTGTSGPHTTGRALDVSVYGLQAFELIRVAPDFGFTGIGISQKGPRATRFIHLDNLPAATNQPRPWVWSY